MTRTARSYLLLCSANMKVRPSRFSRCCNELVKSGVVAKRGAYIRLSKVKEEGKEKLAEYILSEGTLFVNCAGGFVTARLDALHRFRSLILLTHYLC